MVSTHRRLLVCRIGFVMVLFVLWLMLLIQEMRWGEGFRAESARPVRRVEIIAAPRGRIFSTDGQLLAGNRSAVALAVSYRWLEEPPDPQWIRRLARLRLDRRDRNNPAALARAEQESLEEHRERINRLAEISGVGIDQWRRRAAVIQRRVEQMAEAIRRRSTADRGCSDESSNAAPGVLERLRRTAARWLHPKQASPPTIIAEQRRHHVMVEDLSPDAVQTIRREFGDSGDVRLVEIRKRYYPQGMTAAHLIGYIGAVDASRVRELNEQWLRRWSIKHAKPVADCAANRPDSETFSDGWANADFEEDEEGYVLKQLGTEYRNDDRVGISGLERQYEIELRGRSGKRVEYASSAGRVWAKFFSPAPIAGRDLMLTIHLELQRRAETLLDSAIQRAHAMDDRPVPRSGAAVILNASTGAVLAAACYPRFDPSVFTAGDDRAIDRQTADPLRPLFDRAVQMALPPGSAFKIVSACALLHHPGFDPETPLVCNGYLQQPDRQRCELFIRTGRGHGAMTLADALTESCNVYFFHHIGTIGAEPVERWAHALGLGRPTGIDLPGEGSGYLPSALPSPSEQTDRKDDCPIRLSTIDIWNLAVGQGRVATTVLQMAVVAATIANGGRLVRPHLLAGELIGGERDENERGLDAPVASDRAGGLGFLPKVHAPVPVEGIDARALGYLQRALQRVVADENGTAHTTVFTDRVAIAGKTGTAESGGDRPAHGWFVGFAPADRPRVAVAVAIEHGGNGAVSAGPVARELILTLMELRLLD